MFSAYQPNEDLELIHLKLVDESTIVLTMKKFLNVINLKIPTKTAFKSPSNEDVFKALYKMGYHGKLKGAVDFKKCKLPAVW